MRGLDDLRRLEGYCPIGETAVLDAA